MYLPESDALVLYIPQEYPDLQDLEEFRRNVLYFAQNSKYSKIAINLYKLKQIDLKGIKVLIDLKNTLGFSGISIVFYNLNSKLVKYLPSSRIAKCIKLRDEEPKRATV